MSATSVAPPPQYSNNADQYPKPPTPVFTSPQEQAEWELRQRKRRDYEKFKHYAAVGMIILAPTIMLMPPRKLDLYTVALSAAFVTSASQLSKEQYGSGLIDLAGSVYTARRENQKALAALEQQKDTTSSSSSSWSIGPSSLPTAKAKDIQQQIAQSRGEKSPEKQQSWLKKLWMGGESENWQEERAREHAEALERGETIGDLIRSQIDEALGWGQKKTEELVEKDEEVVNRGEKEKSQKS